MSTNTRPWVRVRVQKPEYEYLIFKFPEYEYGYKVMNSYIKMYTGTRMYQSTASCLVQTEYFGKNIQKESIDMSRAPCRIKKSCCFWKPCYHIFTTLMNVILGDHLPYVQKMSPIPLSGGWTSYEVTGRQIVYMYFEHVTSKGKLIY